jgi:hypothetical protein
MARHAKQQHFSKSTPTDTCHQRGIYDQYSKLRVKEEIGSDNRVVSERELNGQSFSLCVSVCVGLHLWFSFPAVETVWTLYLVALRFQVLQLKLEGTDILSQEYSHIKWSLFTVRSSMLTSAWRWIMGRKRL